MLKQILKDMYVDPEILAELPEEQKQILFFKIREEQKRRYYEMEKQFEKKSHKKATNKKRKTENESPKKVQILEDSNSQPWTWVMGEHPNDVSIEEIWANLGNKDWKPAKRDENQPPVSKVQAIIFAQNKNRQNKPNGLSINTSNNTAPIQDIQKSVEDRKTPAKPAVPAAKPKTVQAPPKKSQPIKISQQVPKPTASTSTHHPKPTPPSTPPKPTGVPSASPPSASRKVVPKSANSVPTAPPPLPRKPPASQTKKDVPKKEEADDSDSDPYENMDELADTLPTKELGESEWKTQLRQFKAADERRRNHARRASILVKRMSQQNLAQQKKLKDLKVKFDRRRSTRELIHPANRPSLPPKPTNLRPKHPAPKEGRPAKPASKKEVEQWFKETQTAEILASVDDNNALPTWFHGIIPRTEAETMLESRVVGDFLIRVSDKIWGYALSYKDEHKIKHFLIDASEASCYHFFGNDQIRHPGLEQLIAFHQDEPISYGNEILKKEVGQSDPNKPDYSGLIESVGTNAYINKVTNNTSL